ncbi:MAG: AraC family transcriptional regulator [Spirochaetes bacterium]|nr:AraC family transcriptional regulator [Spirochaetota bacterium]
MVIKIILYIITFAANLSVFQGITSLFCKSDKKLNIKTFLIDICLAIMLFQIKTTFNQFIFKFPEIILMNNTVFFLLCYLLIINFADILLQTTFKSKYYFLFLLLSISLFNDIFILLQDHNHKIFILNMLLTGQNNSQLILMKSSFALSGFLIIYYLMKIIFKTASAWNERDYTAIIIITLAYTSAALICITLVVIGYIFAIRFTMLTGMLIASVIIIINVFLSNKYPEFLLILKTEVDRKSYSRSILTSMDIKLKLQELENIMKDIRPYLDEECSLQQIADDLDITPHQLSQLINEHLGINFNAYINRFRINEACVMLLDEKNRSVLSIAYAVGFNSKSSFYEAFSKNTGITPKDFRKRNS